MSKTITLDFSLRTVAQLTVLFLGLVMTLTGLGSIFTHHSYPEFATAGIGAVLSSGLIGTVGK